MNNTKRILVVDDTPANLKALNELLSPSYNISVATNGQDALRLAKSSPPDLVLLDIMMPGMDGYEVCRLLKSDETTSGIPVIFVTAKTEVEDEQKGFELGGVDYITKPISPPIIKARVKTHLTLKEVREHLEDLVAERTAELQEANKVLQRQLKELEGRDRLVKVQMQGLPFEESYREVLVVLSETVGLMGLTGYGTQSGEGGVKRMVELKHSPRDDSRMRILDDLAQQAAKEKNMVKNNDLFAVPLIYKGDILGVICASGLEKGASRTEVEEIMWRMAGEASLVLHMARVTDDLFGENIDLGELEKLGDLA
ncbi:MAG: response regulator [Desulfobulbaceae bacterium]|nr:response regulator [Desulfobulbaceae bacterium]